MTKLELASYLSSIISIMESKEDAGIHRGRTLGWEYNRCYNDLMEMIREDQADEARKSESERAVGSKEGTDPEGGIPRRSIPDGSTSGESESSGNPLPRPRI